MKRIIFLEKLPTLEELKKSLIKEALKRSKGNLINASKMLGIRVTALNNTIVPVGKKN